MGLLDADNMLLAPSAFPEILHTCYGHCPKNLALGARRHQRTLRGTAAPGSTKERQRSSTGDPSTSRGAEREPAASQERCADASFSRDAPRAESNLRTSYKSIGRCSAAL